MDMNKRENLPAVRITCIWNGERGTTGLPSQKQVKIAAEACAQFLAMLGFTGCCINVGALGKIIEQEKDISKELLEAAAFEKQATIVEEDGTHITPEDRADAHNAETIEKKVKGSKISIEDMLRGIDINNTKEGK